MPRKDIKVDVRQAPPDPVYGSRVLAKFINHVMMDGKRSIAEGLVYEALGTVKEKMGEEDPVAVFKRALDNIRPVLEVKSRRVGGSTYQVPVEVYPRRRASLAMRWLVDAARSRGERGFAVRLANELMDAASNRGSAVKKKEDVHRMAEANKAFAHYRW